MSGYISGRSPDTDAQWALDVEQRLSLLESGRVAVRIGNWVIADRDGELVASTAEGRIIYLSQIVDAVGAGSGISAIEVVSPPQGGAPQSP